MFPYSDNLNDYWTGYFTSRPNSKKIIRDGQSTLHSSNKLFALKMLDQKASDDEIRSILTASDKMFDAVGVNTHHDAVTGTGKDAVAYDYIKRMYKGINATNTVYSKIMNDIINS